MSEPISRRSFLQGSVMSVGAVAAAAVLGSTVRAAAAAPSREKIGGQRLPERTDVTRDETQHLALAALVAPVTVGTKLGTAEVVDVHVDARKVGIVGLADESGRRWDAEICRRASTDGSVRPLAVSRDYSVFLRNNGDGSLPTNEPIGRAVLTIAERIRSNEGSLSTLALASRSEVWAEMGYHHQAVKG